MLRRVRDVELQALDHSPAWKALDIPGGGIYLRASARPERLDQRFAPSLDLPRHQNRGSVDLHVPQSCVIATVIL
jgi:hypothetical protein